MELEHELYLAARDGDIRGVRYLLEQNVNINARSDDGGQTAVYGAAANGHADAIRLLNHYGADIGLPSKDGLTPLAIGIINNHHDVVKEILSLGVDVNESNKLGIKPIHIAASSGDITMVELLQQLGANINATDTSGCNAYFFAIKQSYSPMLRELYRFFF